MKKIIELRNITKSFDGETVLDNINLDIYRGELLCIFGTSGSGKSTLLNQVLSPALRDIYNKKPEIFVTTIKDGQR